MDSITILISAGVGMLIVGPIVAIIAMRRLQAERERTITERERAIRAEVALQAERDTQTARIEAIQSSEQQLRESFAKLSSEALNASSSQFLTLAQERMERQQQNVRGDLAALFGPLRTSLDQQREQVSMLERQREQAYGGLSTMISELKEGQRLLNQETNNLVKALSKPQVRGRWGEMQLRRVVEMAGMLEHCDFETQVPTNDHDTLQRPDLIVRLPNQRQIIVDAKVPLSAFLDALNADDDRRSECWQQHTRLVRTHIDAMCKRNYPANVDGAHDFTVIFVPGEIFYQTALEHDSELLEYAFSKSIILASPNTLVAILKSAAMGWRETSLAAEAKNIRDEGEKMYKALRKVAEHLSKLGTALDRATMAYNEAIGSIEVRLLPPLRKMSDLGAFDLKDLPMLKQSEGRARSILRPELQPEAEANGAEL